MRSLTRTPTTRREFCAGACKAASAVAAGVLTQACGGSSPTSPSGDAAAAPLASVTGAVSGRTVTVAADAVSTLGAVGGAAAVSTPLGRYLVARTGQNSASVVTGVCTHQRCDINGFSNGRFVCPCHGSQFTTGGSVVTGPATAPLQSYVATLTNGQVQFDV